MASLNIAITAPCFLIARAIKALGSLDDEQIGRDEVDVDVPLTNGEAMLTAFKRYGNIQNTHLLQSS